MARERESHKGKFSKDDWQMDLELSGDEVLILKEKGSAMAKIPSKTLKNLLEKKIGRELSSSELAQELSKYTASVDVEAEFYVEEGEPYLYGADADGNRGVMQSDLEDLEADDLEINKLELRFVDENGDLLGGDDFFIDLEDSELIAEYIVDEVNSDMNSYI
jgi:hypothetical protein